MKRSLKLLEFFALEAVDNQGRPLRTQDPFAPPTQHQAVTSKPQGIRVPPKPDDKTIDAITAPNAKRVDKPGYRRPTPNAPRGAVGSQPTGPSPQYAKPGYKGSYVGQTQTTNDRTVGKNVAWKDQFGNDRYGKVQSMQKAQMVWDGNDWIPAQDFDKKFRK